MEWIHVCLFGEFIVHCFFIFSIYLNCGARKRRSVHAFSLLRSFSTNLHTFFPRLNEDLFHCWAPSVNICIIKRHLNKIWFLDVKKYYLLRRLLSNFWQIFSLCHKLDSEYCTGHTCYSFESILLYKTPQISGHILC